MKKLLILLITCLFVNMGLAHADCALQEYELSQAKISSEEIAIEHSKLITMDASIIDPGHVEVDLFYTLQGGSFAWGTDGKRKKRREIGRASCRERV